MTPKVGVVADAHRVADRELRPSYQPEYFSNQGLCCFTYHLVHLGLARVVGEGRASPGEGCARGRSNGVHGGKEGVDDGKMR